MSDTDQAARAILEADVISGTAWGRKGKPDTDLDKAILQTIVRDYLDMREMIERARLIEFSFGPFYAVTISKERDQYITSIDGQESNTHNSSLEAYRELKKL